MKTLIGILFITIAVTACQQTEDYKTVRNEVIKFHDVMMQDQDKITMNHKKLDTLLKDLKSLKAKFPETDTLKEKEAIINLNGQLSSAENQMDDWMHKFEPDVTGKSNADAVQYFKSEKNKVAKIDSLYKKEISASDAYLNRFKK